MLDYIGNERVGYQPIRDKNLRHLGDAVQDCLRAEYPLSLAAIRQDQQEEAAREKYHVATVSTSRPDPGRCDTSALHTAKVIRGGRLVTKYVLPDGGGAPLPSPRPPASGQALTSQLEREILQREGQTALTTSYYEGRLDPSRYPRPPPSPRTASAADKGFRREGRMRCSDSYHNQESLPTDTRPLFPPGPREYTKQYDGAYSSIAVRNRPGVHPPPPGIPQYKPLGQTAVFNDSDAVIPTRAALGVIRAMPIATPDNCHCNKVLATVQQRDREALSSKIAAIARAYDEVAKGRLGRDGRPVSDPSMAANPFRPEERRAARLAAPALPPSHPAPCDPGGLGPSRGYNYYKGKLHKEKARRQARPGTDDIVPFKITSMPAGGVNCMNCNTVLGIGPASTKYRGAWKPPAAPYPHLLAEANHDRKVFHSVAERRQARYQRHKFANDHLNVDYTALRGAALSQQSPRYRHYTRMLALHAAARAQDERRRQRAEVLQAMIEDGANDYEEGWATEDEGSANEHGCANNAARNYRIANSAMAKKLIPRPENNGRMSDNMRYGLMEALQRVGL